MIFYLPESDTFIEINGTWMHGNHWFDKNSNEDKKKLDKWNKKAKEGHKQYKSAINCWTVSDVKKRNTAINHNLSYIVLWNKQDIVDFVKKLPQIERRNIK